MKRNLLISLALLATGCVGQTAHMNREAFSEVDIGEPIADVQHRVGKAYEAKTTPDGLVEYIFIERIEYVRHMPEHLQYVLRVDKEGLVVDKELRRVSADPSGDLDGY